MPSFCLAFQGFQLCSFRHWKIRPSLINVVFVSLRLCCLRSGLWSALWLDSTLLDFKILGLRHSYSFAPYVPTPGARQTAALIHSNILPRCKISLFCSEDATAIFVECLQIMINWRWGWIATLERSANFLTFLHHKFSHFSYEFIQFGIFIWIVWIYWNKITLITHAPP